MASGGESGGDQARVDPWAIHRAAAARKDAGEESIVLLGMGVPDTPSSEEARAALQKALSHNEEGYAEGSGIPDLRRALAARVGASSAECIQVTPGAQTALYLAASLVCRVSPLAAGPVPPEILTPDPAYATYAQTVQQAGGVLVPVPQPKEDDFRLSLDTLAQALEQRAGRAVAVLLTNPHNPTGHVIPAEQLEQLGRLAAQYGVRVICDEVYGPLVFEPGAFCSCASVESLRERALCLGSFSKVGLRPGWRVGWLAVPECLVQPAQDLAEAVLFGISPMMQQAALAVEGLLAPGGREAETYRRRHEALLGALQGSAYARPCPAQGGLFMLVDVSASGAPGGIAFAERLLDEHGFSVLPGAAFGQPLENFIRVGLLAPEEEMARAGQAIALCAESFSAHQQTPHGQAASANSRPQQREGIQWAGAAAAVVCGGIANVEWGKQLHSFLCEALPEASISVWTAQQPPEEALEAVSGAQAVFAWEPPSGLWAACGPELTYVSSMAVGTEHLLAGGALPEAPQLSRLLDPQAPKRMGRYVAHAALGITLGSAEYSTQQRSRGWEPDATSLPVDPEECPVGVMGLGPMGLGAASALLGLGFPVSGWSRSRRAPGEVGFRTFAGAEELEQFLKCLKVLVVVLPLKDSTRGMVGAELMGHLPRGASVVNCGRGELLVQEDLLAMLDSGHIRQAVLDVTDPEPLPAESPLWVHPRVRLTPHIAGRMETRACAEVLVRNWASVRAGGSPTNSVDHQNI